MRRETASAYLKAAGIAVRGRGGSPAKPATSPEVITGARATRNAVGAEQKVAEAVVRTTEAAATVVHVPNAERRPDALELRDCPYSGQEPGSRHK